MVGTGVGVSVGTVVGVLVGTDVAVLVGVGVCVGLGVAVGICVLVGSGVDVGVAVGTGVSVGTGLGVWVAVGTGVGVSVGTGVSVSTGLGVWVAVGTGVGVSVGVGVRVGGNTTAVGGGGGSGVCVGVGVTVGETGSEVGVGVAVDGMCVAVGSGASGCTKKISPSNVPALAHTCAGSLLAGSACWRIGELRSCCTPLSRSSMISVSSNADAASLGTGRHTSAAGVKTSPVNGRRLDDTYEVSYQLPTVSNLRTLDWRTVASDPSTSRTPIQSRAGIDTAGTMSDAPGVSGTSNCPPRS